MKKLLTLSFFLFLITNLQAQTWDGDAGDNDWNNPLNWSTDLVPLAGALVNFNQSVAVISSGAVAPPSLVRVSGSGTVLTLDLDLTIGNGFTVNHAIQINSNASVVIASGRTVNLLPPTSRNGINNGSATANSSMTVAAGATLNIIIANRGMNIQSSSFVFTNNGTIYMAACNNDGINLGSGATFHNNGSLTIGASGREGIDNLGIFNNTGAITIINANTKGIYNKPSGTFTNSGLIDIYDLSVPKTTDDGIFSLGVFNNQLTGVITVGSMIDDGVEAQSSTFSNDGAISLDLSGATLAGHTGLSVGSSTGIGNFQNTGIVEVVSGSNIIGTALFVFPGSGSMTSLTNNGLISLNDGNPVRRFFTQGITINGPTGTINTGDGRINVNLTTFRNNGLIVSNYPTQPGVFTALTALSYNDGYFRTNSSSFSNGTAANISDNGINMNDPAQTTFDLAGICSVTIGGAQASQLWENVLGDTVAGPGPSLSFANAFPDVASATINASGIDVSFTLLNLCAEAVLPIELTRFTATPKEKSVLLEWTTATEIDNDYMAVERSGDARSFTEIGRQQGAGDSYYEINYQLEDTKPLNGINYYRLRQVDLDGTINYSKIITVNFRGEVSSPTILLYPNLISEGGSLEVDLGQFSTQEMHFSIVNAQGQIVANHTLSGGSRQPISVANLTSGTYILVNRNGDSRASAKFVVTQ